MFTVLCFLFTSLFTTVLERQQHLRLEIELQTITFRVQAKVRFF